MQSVADAGTSGVSKIGRCLEAGMGFSIASTRDASGQNCTHFNGTHFGVLSGSIQTLGKIRLLIWALPARMRNRQKQGRPQRDAPSSPQRWGRFCARRRGSLERLSSPQKRDALDAAVFLGRPAPPSTKATERSLEVPVLIAVQGGGNRCDLAAIASPRTGETRLVKRRPVRVTRSADRDPPHDHGLGGLCVDVEQ